MTELNPLVPAKAGTQREMEQVKAWMPACAGMNGIQGEHKWQ
jgi:hypothetical protein